VTLQAQRRLACLISKIALALVFLGLPRSLAAAGFLAPASTNSRFSSHELEERSRRVTATLTDEAAIISMRQVFFNASHHTRHVRYVLPLDESAKILSTSCKFASVEASDIRSMAMDYGCKALFPHLIASAGQRMFVSTPISLGPHRPLPINVRFRTPAIIRGPQRLYRIPFARRGPIIAPIRFFSVAVTATPGLGSLLECPTHRTIPSIARGKAPRFWMSHRDCIPEEDILCILDKRRRGEIRPLTVQAEDGQWLRIRCEPTWRPANMKWNKTPLTVLFVLDTSGSLAGGLLSRVKEAVSKSLNILRPGDRFNLLTFSLVPRTFSHEFVLLSPETKVQALNYIDSIEARGGTNLAETFQHIGDVIATAQPNSDLRMVFVIDGPADVGILSPARLFSLYSKLTPRHIPIEIAALGCNVNARLLASMASHSKGRLRFCNKDNSIEDVLPEMLSTTLATYPGLSINMHASRTLVPGVHNSDRAARSDFPLLIGARLERSFSAPINLSIRSKEKRPIRIDARIDLPTTVVSAPELAEGLRLWHVIGVLRRLIENPAPTCTLPTMEGWQEARIRRILRLPVNVTHFKRKMREVCTATGPEAVERQELLNLLANEGRIFPRSFDGTRFRRVDNRIFSLELGSCWTELPWNSTSPLKRIQYGQASWRRLVATRPDLAAYLALGPRVRFVDGRDRYEIIH